MAIRRDDNKYTRLSLEQYNGQARNGEIVIDLETYTVWVGDASGTLLPVSGGGNMANAIIGNLTVTGSTNLGDLGNITILGGTAGQVISTDGAGNLTWVSAGSASYGNANVANYLPTYTGDLGNVANITASGNIVVLGSVDTTLLTGTSLTLQTTGTNQGINLDPNGTGNINVNNSSINNVNSPVQGGDAANKAYVDGIASGLQIKQFVNALTTIPLPAYTYNNGTAGVGATITANAPGVLTLEGQTVLVGWRVLIKNETGGNAPYNGIYDVTTAGAVGTAFVLTRSADDDTPTEMYSAYTFDDTSNSGWVCLNTATNNPITVGTTPIDFTQFSSAGSYLAGLGLSLTGQVFNALVDGTSIDVNGSNQLEVMPGAQLITPNIGAATGTSITLTGNVSAGNTTTTGTTTTTTLVTTTSTVSGNSSVGGNMTVTGNTTLSNVTSTASTVTGNSAVGGDFAVTGNTTLANVTSTTSTVTGNSAVGGDFAVTGNTTLANVAATNSALTGNSSVGGNFAVTGNTALGNVGNVSILGGNAGQFLQTNGAGNLIWANASGGSANTGNITFANTTLSTVATLSNITLSTYDTANAVTSNWVYGTDGNLTLPSNTSSINYANGAPYGGGTGNVVSIPAIYFAAPATGNNQTFTDASLALYPANTDITLFYNGALIENTGYTLSGTTLTVNFPINTGDSIDIIQTAVGNAASVYSNVDANAFMAVGQLGNVIPFGNAVASLGNATNQWKDLWVSNATIYFNTVPLSANMNTLTFAGEPLLVSNGDSNITTSGSLDVGNVTATGNITANAGYFFIGDGGLLSNISGGGGGTYSNANVAAFLPFYTGNLTSVHDITSSGNITGNGVGLSNIAAANIVGQVANALVSGTVYTNAQPNITSVGTLTSLGVAGNITLGAGGFFIGDGGLLSNIAGGNGTYGNGDVAVFLPTYAGNLNSVDSITTTGNVTIGTGAFIIGDGTYLTNVPGAVAEGAFTIETASFAAVAGSRYGVDTTGGPITATLPATPGTGQAIFFGDAGGAYATNNLTVSPNGLTIMGDPSDMIVNTTNQNFGLFYNGSTWRTY